MSIAFLRVTGWLSTKKAVLLLYACLSIFMASRPVSAQVNLGRISGALRDQSGGAIKGATVSVTDADRGVERTAVTDAASQYSFPGLLPSRKTIKAGFQGFKALEQAMGPKDKVWPFSPAAKSALGLTLSQ